MKTIQFTFNQVRRVGAVAFATALALAPLGTATQSAQAAPSVESQIERWRREHPDTRYNDNDHRRDDWNDRRDRRDWNDHRDWNDRRDRDGRWDNNGRWNGNGRWDRDNRRNNNRRANFSGRVIEDFRGNSFVMRTDSGRTITVQALQNGQARRISRGDRVTVAGYYRGNTFVADDLNFNRDYRR